MRSSVRALPPVWQMAVLPLTSQSFCEGTVSVSVNQPKRADSRRGAGQRAFLSGLRLVLPPSRDNQRAADLLVHEVGPADPPDLNRVRAMAQLTLFRRLRERADEARRFIRDLRAEAHA